MCTLLRMVPVARVSMYCTTINIDSWNTYLQSSMRRRTKSGRSMRAEMVVEHARWLFVGVRIESQ